MKQNGPLGAFAGQLVSKDSSAFGDTIVHTPPALDSIEYAIELVELYWASLLRDVPFTEYPVNATAQAAALELSVLASAHPNRYAGPTSGGNVTPELLFRGGSNGSPAYFVGETVGPYISQLCLLPTTMGRVPICGLHARVAIREHLLEERGERARVHSLIGPAGSADRAARPPFDDTSPPCAEATSRFSAETPLQIFF